MLNLLPCTFKEHETNSGEYTNNRYDKELATSDDYLIVWFDIYIVIYG